MAISMMIYALLLSAGAQISGCLPAIEDTQSVVVDRSWTVKVNQGPRYLEWVTLYSGSPALRRSLQPIAKDDGSRVWGFAGEDIWVECIYRGSSVILSKNLGSLKSCTLEPIKGGVHSPAKLICNR